MISFIITLIILISVAVSISKFTKPTKKKEQVSSKVPTPPIKIINKKYIGGYRRVYYIVDDLGEVYKATIDTLSEPFNINIYTFIGGNITYEQYVEETQK